MNNARIEQIGSPQEVYDHPASPFVFRFIDKLSAVNGSIVGPVPAPLAESTILAFVRPHDTHAELDLKPGEAAFVKFQKVRRFPADAG
jgi:sulfate transport system ATP-binding protein